mmetsp:Transcript_29892/g.77148  ORF Transcript_29892/g.77148 Transcript_29892/m.77148 type:complete len:576 (-) Transcript_29892:809-2536(-)
MGAKGGLTEEEIAERREKALLKLARVFGATGSGKKEKKGGGKGGRREEEISFLEDVLEAMASSETSAKRLLKGRLRDLEEKSDEEDGSEDMDIDSSMAKRVKEAARLSTKARDRVHEGISSMLEVFVMANLEHNSAGEKGEKGETSTLSSLLARAQVGSNEVKGGRAEDVIHYPPLPPNEDVFTSEYWHSLFDEVKGDLCEVDREGPEVRKEAGVEKGRLLLEQLSKNAFFSLPPTQGSVRVEDVMAVSSIMEKLEDKGWPAAFVFAYDTAWRLVEALFPIYETILGDEVYLEPSVFGWMLMRPEIMENMKKTQNSSKNDAFMGYKKRVGNGFWLPHRDFPFNGAFELDTESEGSSWRDEGSAFRVEKDEHGQVWRRRVVSVWLPISDVELDSGCMYVVPKEFDPDFQLYTSEDHLRVATRGDVPSTTEIRFDLQGAFPLPAKRGSVLSWDGNAIHWGGAAAVHTKMPRRSVAFTFCRKSRKSCSLTSALGESSEKLGKKERVYNGDFEEDKQFHPLSREEAKPSRLPVWFRLQLICRSFLRHSFWYSFRENTFPPAFVRALEVVQQAEAKNEQV